MANPGEKEMLAELMLRRPFVPDWSRDELGIAQRPFVTASVKEAPANVRWQLQVESSGGGQPPGPRYSALAGAPP